MGHITKNKKYYRDLPESEVQFCEEGADKFAIRFLVPEHGLLNNLFPFEKTYYKRLSDQLNVSDSVIKIRFKKVYWDPLKARHVLVPQEIDLDRLI